ncbi:MAG: protein kinase domain-containing protein, partial [Planctomycetaceae bacterium]
MGQSNDDLSYPAEPGTETKIRFARSRETTHGSEDDRVDPPLWKVGDIVEGFVLEQLLGSGVTSTVYRVRELETDRRYALKILRTRCEQTRTASRLGFRRMIPFSHPSLVYVDRILSIGEYIGFTMEEVVGKRLVEVINETRGQGRAAVFDLAYRLLHDIGGALQTIHDAGLVHRDVKPENVMVDINGRAKLIDYGLVGSYDPESDPDARRNYLAGTYWYMAPESISMQMYPPACDVYALGSVVLELIADHSQLPQEQAGVSLGLAIGDVRSF